MSSFKKRLKPVGQSVIPMNNLSGMVGVASSSKRNPSQQSAAEGPVPKKQRLHSHEPDNDLDSTLRRELSGSQGSMRPHPMPSAAVAEFRNVEKEATAGGPRRKPRHGSGTWMHTVPRESVHSPTLDLYHDQIQDDDDEVDQLAPREPKQPSSCSTANASKPALRTTTGGDSSDVQFSSKPTKTRKNTTPGPSKRQRASVVCLDDEADELADWTPPGAKRKTASRSRSGPSDSLSRNGDIKPAKFVTKKPKLNSDPHWEGVRVVAAVCPNRHLYEEPESADISAQCSLSVDEEGNLVLTTAAGERPRNYAWVKITKTSMRISWATGSSIIRILQPRDGELGIDGPLTLKLGSPGEAYRVAIWAKDRLHREVGEFDITKLQSMFDKMKGEVEKALSQHPVPKTAGPVEDVRAASESGNTKTSPNLGLRSSRGRLLLKDRMRTDALGSLDLVSSDPVSSDPVSSDVELPPRRPQRQPRTPITRSSRLKDPITVEEGPRRWTEENPGWEKDWASPLVYGRTTVDKEDIPRLDEGQCLNDNILAFGLAYLQQRAKSAEASAKKIHFLNSFFFPKLTSDKSYKNKINYDGVKNWTSKIDILSYDYIIVPVNKDYHWWLAIICNPGRLDPDALQSSPAALPGAGEKEAEAKTQMTADVEVVDVSENNERPASIKSGPGGDSKDVDVVNLDEDGTAETPLKKRIGRPPKRGGRKSTWAEGDPVILTLDSLGGGHSSEVTALKYYLAAEFEHRRKKVIEPLPTMFGRAATNIPQQNNFSDCGVYLLGYVLQFLQNPDGFVKGLLEKEEPDWTFNASDLRNSWRETIMVEQRRKLGLSDNLVAHSTPKLAAEKQPPNQDPSTSHLRGGDLRTAQQSVEDATTSRPVQTILDDGESNCRPAPMKQDLPDLSPNQRKLPGAWPGKQMSPVQPSDKMETSTTALSPPEKPDSWQGPEGPVKFLSKIPSSPVAKERSDSVTLVGPETVSKYFALAPVHPQSKHTGQGVTAASKKDHGDRQITSGMPTTSSVFQLKSPPPKPKGGPVSRGVGASSRESPTIIEDDSPERRLTTPLIIEESLPSPRSKPSTQGVSAASETQSVPPTPRTTQNGIGILSATPRHTTSRFVAPESSPPRARSRPTSQGFSGVTTGLRFTTSLFSRETVRRPSQPEGRSPHPKRPVVHAAELVRPPAAAIDLTADDEPRAVYEPGVI